MLFHDRHFQTQFYLCQHLRKCSVTYCLKLKGLMLQRAQQYLLTAQGLGSLAQDRIRNKTQNILGKSVSNSPKDCKVRPS